jgi:tyramine---L-glutamate ligase
VTSGGLSGDRQSQFSDSIRREGIAMITALAADFATLPGLEALVLVDNRVSIALPGCRILPVRSRAEEFDLLAKWSGEVDWTVVIAPDFELTRCRLVEIGGGRLLGPPSAITRLAADKQQTAEHLSPAGVRVPKGIAIATLRAIPDTFPFPAVIKPRFGAGSQDVRLVRNRAELSEWPSTPPLARIEQFCPGTSASVAFLCGPNGCFSLPPCRQRLSDDGEFRYLGGALPLEPALAHRATELAARAVATLPNPLGYLGVDLVLGDAPNGQDDVVIEINPRLTTSYVGLRALARENLAAAMLDAACGRTSRLSFADRQLEFDSDGTIRET